MLKYLFRGLCSFVVLIYLASSAIAQMAQPIAGPANGAFPAHYLSAANTNSTNVAAVKTNIYEIVAVNTTATLYFLKLYDKATAPTCGTDTPVMTLPIPFGTSSSGGGVSVPIPVGAQFINGFGFCITGGIADNDSTSAATGIAVNFLYQIKQ